MEKSQIKFICVHLWLNRITNLSISLSGGENYE